MSRKVTLKTWTGLPTKLNMSKTDTVTRKCHTSNTSELCQSHSRQNICRCHFYAQTPQSCIRHPPVVGPQIGLVLGFNTSPVSCCSLLLRLLFILLSLPLFCPLSSPVFCLLLLTHPPSAGVLLVRRLDWLPPPSLLSTHPPFISYRTCKISLYPVSLTADWSGIFRGSHVPALVFARPHILSHTEGSVPGRRLVRVLALTTASCAELA